MAWHRTGDHHIQFSSTILPPYARRSKSLEVLIPILYLKDISTGDFEQALITCSARMPAVLCLDHHADVATTDADAVLTHLEQVL